MYVTVYVYKENLSKFIKSLTCMFTLFDSGQSWSATTTSWLRDKFISFEPPVIDERMETVRFVEKSPNNDQRSKETTYGLRKGQRPLYPNIVGCRNPDTLAEMMDDWKSKINGHYEEEQSQGMHAGLWPADMTEWKHCTDETFSKLVKIKAYRIWKSKTLDCL